MKTKIALVSSVMLVAMFALAPDSAAALPVSGIGHGSQAAATDHSLVQNVHGWWRRPWVYGYYGPYAYYRPYAYYYRPYVYYRPYYYYAPYYYRGPYCPRYYRYY